MKVVGRSIISDKGMTSVTNAFGRVLLFEVNVRAMEQGHRRCGVIRSKGWKDRRC